MSGGEKKEVKIPNVEGVLMTDRNILLLHSGILSTYSTDLKEKSKSVVAANANRIELISQGIYLIGATDIGGEIGTRNEYYTRFPQEVEKVEINGFSDAMIAAQQLTVAAEELGLGCVYFGSIVNDYGKLSKILKLPKGAFPVVGVGFGYPNQKPQIKPRMSMDLKFFEDTYKEEENYMAQIKDYDEEMTTYYDTREEGRRSDCFSDQIVSKYAKRVFERDQILKVIRDQGFDLKI